MPDTTSHHDSPGKPLLGPHDVSSCQLDIVSPFDSRRRWSRIALWVVGSTGALLSIVLAILVATNPPASLPPAMMESPSLHADRAANLDPVQPLSTAREVIESARWRATGILEFAGIPAALLGLPRTCVALRCLDSSGTPAGDVRVRASIRGFSLSSETGDRGWASVCTRVLTTPEVVEVRAVARDFSFWKGRTTLAPGESANFGEVQLQAGAAIAGRVVTRLGLPVAGAWVAVKETWSQLGSGALLTKERWTRTDLLGRFRLDGLPTGTTELRAWRGREAATTGRIELRAGELSGGHDLVLSPTPLASVQPLDPLRGFVVDPSGLPVPRSRVICRRDDGSTRRLTADDSGMFKAPQIRKGVWLLKAYDPGERWSEAVVEDLDVERQTEDVLLVLGPPRNLEMIVVDREGRPVERYAVELVDLEMEPRANPLNPQGALERRLPRRLSNAWPLPQRRAPGGLSSVGVPRGEFVLRVESGGFKEGEIGPLTAGSVRSPLIVQLDPIAGVRGAVFAEGNPLPGADVQLRRVLGNGELAEVDGEPCRFFALALHRVKTDEEGRFVLHPPEPGAYVVQARAEGYAMSESEDLDVDPAIGARGIVLDLGRGGRIEGLVRVPQGWGPAGHVVVASRYDGEPRRVRTDVRGRFAFSGLTGGPWSVRIGEQEGYSAQGVNGDLGPLFSIFQSGQSSDRLEPNYNCTVLDGVATSIELVLQ